MISTLWVFFWKSMPNHVIRPGTIGTHHFLDENWFPKCMLWLLHKRIIIQSSPHREQQMLSHLVLLLTTEYATQRTMASIFVHSRCLSPQKNNDQYLNNVCFHSRCLSSQRNNDQYLSNVCFWNSMSVFAVESRIMIQRLSPWVERYSMSYKCTYEDQYQAWETNPGLIIKTIPRSRSLRTGRVAFEQAS